MSLRTTVAACTQVWTEFKVIQETSALTFMVAGVFKEIVTGALRRRVLANRCRMPILIQSRLSGLMVGSLH